MSEAIALICRPVADAASIIPGTRHGECSTCRTLVWMSPSSVEVLRTHEAVVLCLPCGAKQGMGDLPIGIAAGQLEELCRYYQAIDKGGAT